MMMATMTKDDICVEVLLNEARREAENKMQAAQDALVTRINKANRDADVEHEEMEIMAEICAEVNGDGKPMFSNETSRKAELMKRIGESSLMTSLVERRDDAARKLAEAEISREWHHDLHRAYVAAMYAMRD